MTKSLQESIHFEKSVKFKLHFKAWREEETLRSHCKKFHIEVFLKEPEKPYQHYPQNNGDQIRFIKTSANTYSAYYRTKSEVH